MQNLILVLFGPSGCGKSMYKKFFVENGWINVESTTSRPKRSKEEDEYKFVSKKQWMTLFKSGKLINVNEYHGQYYGVESRLLFHELGPKVVISDITSLSELRRLAKIMDKQLFIAYCAPPENFNVLRKRHEERGTPERINVAYKEIMEFYKRGLSHEIDLTFRNLTDAEVFISEVKKQCA